MQSLNNVPQGMYRDMLKGSDGHIRYDSGWTSNTIVERCHILLAGFMNNGPTNGIQYLAVGEGDAAWDTPDGPPPSSADATDLVSRYPETIPFAQLALAYLDMNNEVVTGPTNRLQITATLSEDFPTPPNDLNAYPLREFGLFGSFGGEDYMINCIRHPVIHKDTASRLIRVVRLQF